MAEERYDDAAARLLEAIGICPDCPDNSLLLSNLGMVYAYKPQQIWDGLGLATGAHVECRQRTCGVVAATRARP